MTIPRFHLISHNLCPYVQRAVITLLEKDIPHDRTYIDLSNKPAWFTQISPLGRVPLLQVGDDVLFESAVICEYLDEVTPGSLHPTDPLEKAKHRAWIEFGSNLLDEIAGFYSAKDEVAFNHKRQRLTDKFGRVESFLTQTPYFSGTQFSLVDAVYGPIFRYFDAFDLISDFHIFAETPKVSRWRQALRSRPSVQNAVSSDYSTLLLDHLKQKSSYFATLIRTGNTGLAL